MGRGGGPSGGSFITKGKPPIKGKPNSVVTKVDKNGNIVQQRYYDQYGRAEKDIDFTNHGNPKLHPIAPHVHRWHWFGEKCVRSDD